MRSYLIAAVLVTFSVSASAAVKAFGKPLAGLEPTPVSSILSQPENGATVRLQGTIEKVCLKKGCWLVLAEGGHSIHVTFVDYSFFVPTDSAGSAVALEGTVKVEAPDKEHVEHLQGEGAGKEAAADVSIVATGVEIQVAE